MITQPETEIREMAIRREFLYEQRNLAKAEYTSLRNGILSFTTVCGLLFTVHSSLFTVHYL